MLLPDSTIARIALVTFLSLAGVECTLIPQLQQPVQPENAIYFDEAFDAFVLETIGAWHVPGLSIAVVDGEKVYSKVDTGFQSKTYAAG